MVSGRRVRSRSTQVLHLGRLLWRPLRTNGRCSRPGQGGPPCQGSRTKAGARAAGNERSQKTNVPARRSARSSSSRKNHTGLHIAPRGARARRGRCRRLAVVVMNRGGGEIATATAAAPGRRRDHPDGPGQRRQGPLLQLRRRRHDGEVLRARRQERQGARGPRCLRGVLRAEEGLPPAGRRHGSATTAARSSPATRSTSSPAAATRSRSTRRISGGKLTITTDSLAGGRPVLLIAL